MIAIEIVEELEKIAAMKGNQPRKVIDLIQTMEKALADLTELGNTTDWPCLSLQPWLGRSRRLDQLDTGGGSRGTSTLLTLEPVEEWPKEVSQRGSS
ncbi:hypothetical protein SKAU_G00279940 [Synaphobranchus kaupii]|uniref:Uncharacterized protein n=1 Tax=Synaphobranchus kaupii TaxID=118154 RepID=A0A9Q1EWT7_SYNKA|nr:hypothetical protein SKAU_G00279940 [Synaphobranchus kaupii]